LLDECQPQRRRLELHLLRGLCRVSQDAYRASSLEVTRVAFTHDGRYLVTASGDAVRQNIPGEVGLWDRATGRQVFLFKNHTGAVIDLSVSPDDAWIASASRTADWLKAFRQGKNTPASPSGEVFVWKRDGTGMPRKLEGCYGSVSFSSDGGRLAAAGLDNTIKLWETKTWSEPVILRPPSAKREADWPRVSHP